MSFDFSTLITDRKKSDADYARALMGRITNGTATEEELAEWNAAALKGVYDYTDLNRVTAAMDAVNQLLSETGHKTGYQPVKVHPGSSSDFPDGYTELESIESTGTQYIKIPYYPNQNTRVVLDYLPKSTNNTILFGSRTSTSSSDLFLILHASDTNSLRTDFGGSKVTTGMNPDIRTVIDKDQNKTKILGQSFYSGAATFTCKYPMGIFCGNTGGSYTQLSSYVLYSCKIYDGEALLYDLKPCQNPDNEIGLFDIVTQTFFGNSGTGSFIGASTHKPEARLPKGYQELLYIGSTGQQHIDTGIIPTSNSKIEMDGYIGEYSDTFVFFGARSEKNSGDPTSNCLFALSGNSFRSDYFGSAVQTGGSIRGDFSIVRNKNVTKIASGNSYTLTNSVASGECLYTLYLFAVNTANEESTNGTFILYSCRISGSEDQLLREYVPCQNTDGEIGLYDLSTGEFYGNSGSGSFYAGPVIDTEESSDGEEENDPYTWYEFDSPTLPQLTQYLENVRSLRSAIANQSPDVPGLRDMFSVEAANDIEKILLAIEYAIQIMKQTYVPCGATACGGDYL
jgi:hypothetical protein|nr:hypothetical protein [uncultured Oscillibacter sp.]DAZ27274.1 MAG TPA: hypothetical protein [Caudoviricetes sp.]